MTMRSLEEEREVRAFNDLVPQASSLHEWTWCVKRQTAIATRLLRGEECVPCPEWVGRGGPCDPL